MNSLLLNNEPLIRFGFFFGILILMAVWEGFAPRRQTARDLLSSSLPVLVGACSVENTAFFDIQSL
jgi:hypothetical protein